MTSFKIGNKEYSLEITYWKAVKEFPKQFNINIVALFEDNNLDSLLQRMYLGDELALDLIRYYTDGIDDFDTILKDLTQAEIKKFKDAWWECLLNFFDPLRRDTLKDILQQAPKLIKDQVGSQLKKSIQELSNPG